MVDSSGGMSRAAKRQSRAAARETFLASRPLICCECGVRSVNEDLAAKARRLGITEAMCDDCSWDVDLDGWEVEVLDP
jgi:hypothetical protein